MIWTEFSTDHVLAPERYRYWDSIVSQALVPTTLVSEHLADFRASSEALDLDRSQIFAQSYPSLQAFRTPQLIRQGDPGVFQLWLTVSGKVEFRQADRHTVVGAGDFVLYDSSRPFHGRAAAVDGDAVSSLIMQFPRAALPLPSNLLDHLTARCISGQAGVGALFRRYLTDLMDHAPTYDVDDAPRLAKVTLDLCSAVLASAARTEAGLELESQQSILRARIKAFIQQHLADPGLTPASIAAAHHISSRQLHRIYRDEGRSVAESIRASRLEAIRRDLGDPRLRSQAIGLVAARWGMVDQSYFSRAFRVAYNITPRDYRHQILKRQT